MLWCFGTILWSFQENSSISSLSVSVFTGFFSKFFYRWQDSLNQHNQIFFDHCNGIFLNYCYDESKTRSWNLFGAISSWFFFKLEKIQESAQNAKSKKKDVYAGIDLFGRNTYGGGGFSTYKALQLISHYQLSCALFAPGWTVEASPYPNRLSFDVRAQELWYGFQNDQLIKDSDDRSVFEEIWQTNNLNWKLENKTWIPDPMGNTRSQLIKLVTIDLIWKVCFRKNVLTRVLSKQKYRTLRYQKTVMQTWMRSKGLSNIPSCSPGKKIALNFRFRSNF